MEIHFNETAVPTRQEMARLTKTAQMTMESVVPDTKDDIGRILSVRPQLYLKSKDIRNRSAYIEGEALLAVLYLNEAENSVSYFTATQSIALDYDLPVSEDESSLQVRLNITGLQARAVNPRKVSVDMELSVELALYRDGSSVVSQSLPEQELPPIHVRSGECEGVLLTSVCEKSLSANEQLPFSDEESAPEILIFQETSYRIDSREAVGNRLLVKGEAQLLIHYYPANTNIPSQKVFTIPFSQLFDLGEQEISDAEIWITPTSDYVELIDAIDGRKLLSAELHAVTQLRGVKRETLRYIDDAYSNRMTCECQFTDTTIDESVQIKPITLSAEESVELPEEAEELISAYATPGQCSAEKGTVVLDLLCRSTEGKLFAMRRTVGLASPENSNENTSLVALGRPEINCAREGHSLSVSIRAAGESLTHRQRTLRRVSSLNLDEDQMIDTSAYPSMTAVWAETESVWELAKLYHSSPEAIASRNEGSPGNPVFIPKTL